MWTVNLEAVLRVNSSSKNVMSRSIKYDQKCSTFVNLMK